MADEIDYLGNGISGDKEFIDPATVIGTGGGSDNAGNSGTGAGRIIDAFGTEFDERIHVSPDSRNKSGAFRNRKSSGRGPSQTKTKIHSDIKASAEMLTRGLMIFHTSLAAMTQTPELILSEGEASGLSETGLTLLQLYDIKPDPKVEAAILFAGQIGLVYGSRIIAIRARKSNEKTKRRRGDPSRLNADETIEPSAFATQEWPMPPETGNGNIGSIN